MGVGSQEEVGPGGEVGPPARVSTLELFFDLVFVFTITQLTSVLVHEPTRRGLVQVVLMLGVIWWMYGGYAWLTNEVAPDRVGRRLLLLGGMAGFLVLALSIPSASPTCWWSQSTPGRSRGPPRRTWSVASSGSPATTPRRRS